MPFFKGKYVLNSNSDDLAVLTLLHLERHKSNFKNGKNVTIITVDSVWNTGETGDTGGKKYKVIT